MKLKISEYIKKYKITLFFGLIILEIILICLLLWHIFYSTDTIIINSIPDDYIDHPASPLSYYYEFHPDNKIVDKQNWLSYTPIYTINRDGLNNSKDYIPEKDLNNYRIVTLGDSHTFGYLVNTSDSYPEQLEAKLNKHCDSNLRYEVLNLGIPGYDIQYSVERYQRKGLKYDPDLVVWFLRKDDFTEIKEKTGPKIEYYKKHPDPEELKNFTKMGFHYYETYKAMQVVQKELGRERMVDLQTEYLVSIRKYYSGPLVIITYNDSELADYQNVIQTLISSGSSTYYFNGIPNLNRVEGLHLQDSHPNKLGYAILVDKLFNYLKEEKLSRCN